MLFDRNYTLLNDDITTGRLQAGHACISDDKGRPQPGHSNSMICVIMFYYVLKVVDYVVEPILRYGWLMI